MNAKLVQIETILNKIPYNKVIIEINRIVENLPIDKSDQLKSFKNQFSKEWDEIQKSDDFGMIFKQWVSSQMLEHARKIFDSVRSLLSEYSPDDVKNLQFGDFMYYVKN